VTDSKSRNAATGPIAAHVFETPGSYTVTLTVTDAAGNVGTKTQAITVTNPDTVFATTNTICVSTSGTFTSAPAGCVQLTTSDAGHATILAARHGGKRILFRRGETFSLGTQWDPDGTTGIIGAFGTGALPIINYTPAYTYFALCTGTDWHIQDLDIRTTQNIIHGPWSWGGTNITFARISLTGFAAGFNCNDYTTDSGFCAYECTIGTLQKGTGDGSGLVGAWLSVSKLMWLGTTVVDTSQCEHNLRIPTCKGGVVGHSIFNGAGDTKACIKIHGYATNTEKMMVHDNQCYPNITNYWPCGTSPQNGNSNELLNDIFWERNFIKMIDGVNAGIALNIAAARITIRNNVIYLGTTAYIGVNIDQQGPEPAPTDVLCSNNTFYSTAATATTYGVQITAVDSAMAIYNNLLVGQAGNNLSSVVQNSGATSSVVSHNLKSMNSTTLVSATPSVVADYALHTASAAIDYGIAAGAFCPKDYAGTARPIGAAPDAGAYESF
jgi:PKD repeat protein